ncbi:MAG: hypothetical protein MAG715_01298 [Methanonatronarchaeales archaeon]|nr:hypothetical protein [Methanonatronarchaeales archaeon]
MPTEEEFIKALELIESYIAEIDDEIEERSELGVEDIVDENGAGFTCKHGDYTYHVVGRPENRYLQIIFPFNFQQVLTIVLTEENAENYLDSIGASTEETGEDFKLFAAKEMLKSLEPEEQRSLMFYLLERLASPHTGHRTIFDDQGAFQGFQVERRVFPYEEGFSLSTFNDSVQSVVSVGARGARFLQKTFRLQIEGAGTEDERAEMLVNLPSEP